MEKKTTTIKKSAVAKKIAKPAVAPVKASHSVDANIEAVGRRKTSVARVRIYTKKTHKGSWDIVINEKPFAKFFITPKHQQIILQSFQTSAENFPVTVLVNGGGVNSQAEATRHAIARALNNFDITLRKDLKKKGFLKRDPRAKERRKFGLKKARKSPQWSKR